MKIVKTPLRISLFGGGTDYPTYFERSSGIVVGGTINKYIYTSALPLFSGSRENLRFNYRITESVQELKDITHPIVREWLLRNELPKKYSFSTVSDIPGGSGLGSSSAFTIGFIDIVDWIRGHERSRESLAQHAIYLEREILGEKVGYQDQYHAAFGGFSAYEFSTFGTKISSFNISPECMSELSSSCFLIFTGRLRKASLVLDSQNEKTRKGSNDSFLDRMKDIAICAKKIINESNLSIDIKSLSELLNESWMLKKQLSPEITNSNIENISKLLIDSGCYATKLLGAGAGGFVLGLGPSGIREKVAIQFGKENLIDFNFNNCGSQRIQITY